MNRTVERMLNLCFLRTTYSVNKVLTLVIINRKLKISHENIDTFISLRYSNIVSIFTVLCLEKIGTKLFKYFTCPCISILISKVSKISLHFKAPLFKT